MSGVLGAKVLGISGIGGEGRKKFDGTSKTVVEFEAQLIAAS
jgi:hypothetical protein